MEQHTFESNPIARQPAVPLQPVIDPAGWTAEEMRSTGDWVYQLSATEIGEIAEAVEGVKKRAIAIIDIRREDFPLPSFGPALDDFRREILHGRGFKTLRGVPVADYTIEQSAIACFGIGTYIGKAVSQNAMGHLLGHVRDLNVDPNSPTKRGYHSSGSLPFHSDSCDVVGLLCLHAAKTGGTSAIVPTVTLHNKLLKRRPDLVEALSQPMYRDRRGEVPEGMTNWYALPYFNYNEGYLTTTKGYFITSKENFPEDVVLTPKQIEAVEVVAALAQEFRFDMEFLQGDFQFLHNHVMLHARTDYEDWPEPERMRHLLRLWLSTPDEEGGRPLPQGFYDRYAITKDDGRPGGIICKDTVLKAPLIPE